MTNSTKKGWLEQRLLDDPAFRLEFDTERACHEFVEQFETVRERRGISRVEVANLLGKSKAYVSQTLNKGRNLTVRTMVELAAALDHEVHLQLHPRGDTTGRDDALRRVTAERDALLAERDNPETSDFLDGVKREAAHQRARWGRKHDEEKTDADWFWLVGYLAGKALHASDPDKRLHHIITTAAALLNWHLFALGEQLDRPTTGESPYDEGGSDGNP